MTSTFGVDLNMRSVCSMTSEDSSKEAVYGIIFGNRNGFGLVCSVTNLFWAGGETILEVVERLSCSLARYLEKGVTFILCFDNLPSRLSGT